MAAAALLATACTEPDDAVGSEPVVAGIDLPDIELRTFLTELIEAVRTTPASASMRGRLAMTYDANGFPEAAIASYRQAETLVPDDFRWPHFASLLLAQQGQIEAALDASRRALAIDASYAPAWLWRGTWLLALERFEDAALAFAEAGERGADAEADFGQAMVHVAEGRFDEAVATLEPLAVPSAHPHLHRTFGQALAALGREDAARLALARGREPLAFAWDDPRAAEKTAFARGYAAFAIAQSWSSEGNTAPALAVFERLEAHYPERQCAAEEDYFFACNLLNSLSIAHGRAGDLDLAIALAQRGIALNADFAPFHLALADHYRQRRDLPSALMHIDRAIALNPGNGHAHTQRGRYLHGLGRFAEARTAFDAALRLAPSNRATLFYAGLVEVALEDWAGAARHFADAVRIDPDFALGHLYLARSLGEGGRLGEARQALAIAQQRGAVPSEVRATEVRLRELETAP